MKTIWNSSELSEIKNRIARLAPGTHARWGTMSVPQMVVHLTDSLHMAAGDLPVAPRKMPIRFTPLKQLIIYALPFPKGAPTAPELKRRVPGEWQAEIASLQSALDEFARHGPSKTAPTHPAFGRMTGRAWGVLVYRHMNHHLRQFGV